MSGYCDRYCPLDSNYKKVHSTDCDLYDQFYRPPTHKPIRDWSLAARVMLAGALMGLTLHVSTAWALSGAELDALLPKIVMAESSGNPDAVGPSGERGLMQIHPATWKAMSGEPWSEAFNPEKNVQVGRSLLEEINRNYGRRATRALIIYTYNTGRYVKDGDHLPRWTTNHPNRIYRRIFEEQ